MEDKAKKVIAEFEEIERQLANPDVYSDQKKFVALSQKRKQLELKVELAQAFETFSLQKKDAENMIKTETEAEIIEMAKAELEEAKKMIPELEEKLKVALIPRDPKDDANAIVEIRPGAGGDESALFAEELSRMVLRFSEEQGFKAEIMSETINDGGG